MKKIIILTLLSAIALGLGGCD
ncbi:MAG: hypothetical protein ACD_42C00300G0001, partial [uncultured bacterium]